MSGQILDKFVAVCKSNDIDAKVEVMVKLQEACSTGIEILDPEPVINALKTCLRASNQLLTAATLSCLPQLIPLLVSRTSFHQAHHPQQLASASSSTSSAYSPSIDSVSLRHILNAFLPAGGLLDRLGEAREKTRDKARETIIVIGGLAFRTGGPNAQSSRIRDPKAVETPIMIFERYVKEAGLSSKVWRVREQCIIVLVNIRRAHHLFPIRPYLPQLVATLEDGDGNVRECARASIVELFTSPAVTDAARADLKKEMTKKGVRKNIVDGILAKLVAGTTGNGVSSVPASDASDSGDIMAGKKEYIPPSMMLQQSASTSTVSKLLPRPASHAALKDAALEISPALANETAGVEFPPIYITSAKDMDHEFEAMVKPYEGKESEHNWAARQGAIIRVRGMLKGGAHSKYPDAFMRNLKHDFITLTLKALASLRTTVAAHTCLLYNDLAMALGPSLDPFCEVLLSALLRMAGFTKKTTAQQSQASITVILQYCSAQPRSTLPLIWTTLQEKTVQARAFVVGHIVSYLEFNGVRAKHAIETSGGVEILEKCLKKAIGDPNPAVRENARKCFWIFEGIWHEKGLAILGSLDATARKQLEKACPTPEAAAKLISPTTPITTKKTSIAAAIAASRAKAKAIAESPPTLRHQATSSSHAARASSPPLRVPSSPTALMSRSTTSPVLAKTRVSPRTSLSRSPPSRSPPLPHSRTGSSPSIGQRPSSPLGLSSSPSGGTLRKAMQTALPQSPPHPPPTSREILRTPLGRSATTMHAVPIRQSIITQMDGFDNDSLLLATEIPIPEDSDSDGEHPENLMSFSSPYEKYPPRSDSQKLSLSSASSSSRVITLSGHATEVLVEDVLRSRAEQAENTAARLLELVDERPLAKPIAPTVLASKIESNNSTRAGASDEVNNAFRTPPKTPINKVTVAAIRQAALFKHSPANGSSSSTLDILQDHKNETGWWLKRMELIDRTPARSFNPSYSQSDQSTDLNQWIKTLSSGSDSIPVLKKLITFSVQNSVIEPSSPAGGQFPGSPTPNANKKVVEELPRANVWTHDKVFDRLFDALMAYLDPTRTQDELEYGLILLWELINNQAPLVDGSESDIFNMLFNIRYSNQFNVLEATNTFRDALVTRIEPVYGMTTMHAALRAFSNKDPSSISLKSATVKAASYAFGMIAIGKFILRLPFEVLEDELPRLKTTLLTSLSDPESLVIREAAASVIIAAQLVLRDETHLFTLLDGLPDDKKNLLTYLFDKHGTRDFSATNGVSGVKRLTKEMNRLDIRSNNVPKTA